MWMWFTLLTKMLRCRSRLLNKAQWIQAPHSENPPRDPSRSVTFLREVQLTAPGRAWGPSEAGSPPARKLSPSPRAVRTAGSSRSDLVCQDPGRWPCLTRRQHACLQRLFLQSESTLPVGRKQSLRNLSTLYSLALTGRSIGQVRKHWSPPHGQFSSMVYVAPYKGFGDVVLRWQAWCRDFCSYVGFTLRESKICRLLPMKNSQENVNFCFIFPMCTARHEAILDQEFLSVE